MSGKVFRWSQCTYSLSVYFNVVLLLIWTKRGKTVEYKGAANGGNLWFESVGTCWCQNCTHCTDARFNIYFQTSNACKNIMLPCSWKWRQRVMLTTPLTYSLSWRIIHHCWWSKIATLLRQDWVSSVRMFSGKQDYMAISPKQGEYNDEMFIEWCGIVYCDIWLVYWLNPSVMMMDLLVDELVMLSAWGGVNTYVMLF